MSNFVTSINYRETLDTLGWVVIPNVIDRSLGLHLREMLAPCKEIAWQSNYKFPQRTYLNKLRNEPLKAFIDLQTLDLANQIMGDDG